MRCKSIKQLILYITDVRTAVDNPVFLSVLTLLKMLYERDCRRPFAPEGHWLIK